MLVCSRLLNFMWLFYFGGGELWVGWQRKHLHLLRSSCCRCAHGHTPCITANTNTSHSLYNLHDSYSSSSAVDSPNVSEERRRAAPAVRRAESPVLFPRLGRVSVIGAGRRRAHAAGWMVGCSALRHTWWSRRFASRPTDQRVYSV